MVGHVVLTLTDADGDGVWEGTFSLPVGDFEYIYCTDGWAGTETAGLITEMQNGETCAWLLIIFLTRID